MKQAIVILFLLTLTAGNSPALTIRVPSEQPTIQAGIDASVDGDTVLVADGTYIGTGNKNINFGGKAITVLSENGPENTIIDCETNGRGFFFSNGEDSFSRLEGFTIRNGNGVGFGNGSKDGYGGGIYCYKTFPTITNCTITGNTASGNGGGIYCPGGLYHPSPSPTITNCTITGTALKMVAESLATGPPKSLLTAH